ncbi:hypothetical protein [Mesorhizobium sp.]|nr:hypothetical protein [Mesorhizobium sp.]
MSIATESVSEAEISREIDQDRPLSYFETELPDLPLTRLQDRTFEILAYSLIQKQIEEGSTPFTRATLLRDGADQGRDVLLLKGEEVRGVIQCKRYEDAFNRPSVLRELLRFAMLAVRVQGLVPKAEDFSYQLWTAGSLTGPAIKFFDAPKTYISDNRSQLLQMAANARKGVAALVTSNSKEADAENEAAVALISQFAFEAVGPVDIKSRLADNEQIRRRFFRGPGDAKSHAVAGDIARLLKMARQAFPSGLVNANLYVARSALTAEFERFMASPARLFAVVGTSGQGKSSWARWVRDNPPLATTVDIVRGEDIRDGHLHIVDTIAHMLESRQLGQLSGVPLKQGIFDWINDSSRLLIIDGLDRSPSRRLDDWLTHSFAIATGGSTRFVITSRQLTWSMISPDITVDPSLVHIPKSQSNIRFPALELGPLDEQEIAATYLAYGLPAPAPGARSFRTPGLIAMEAGVRQGNKHLVGTRLAVLLESLDELQRGLYRQNKVGTQQFKLLTDKLGDLLVDNGMGRIDAPVFRAGSPELVPALDAAIDSGFASEEDETIRVEPDDLIEFLMARRLNPAGARKLVDQISSDLAIGAAALSAARLEASGANEVRGAIHALRDGADFRSASLAAAARAVTELKSPDLARELASALLDDWDGLNFLLSLSPLVPMLDEIALPPLERLKLAMRLAPSEDVSDWRGKYFYDDDLVQSRRITGFGHAAARAIAADPRAALNYLIQLFDDATLTDSPIDDYESVESGLLYLAISGAPDDAAAIGWRRRDSSDWLLDRVASVEPDSMARLLGSITNSSADRTDAAERLWSLVKQVPRPTRNDEAFGRSLASSADNLLHQLDDEPTIVRMLITKLLATSDPDCENRLSALWEHVDDEAFWHGLRVLPRQKISLLRQRFSPAELSRSSSNLLEMMPAGLFEIDEWSDVTEVLRDAASSGLGVSASLALETLLYRGAALGMLQPLMPLAREFASSKQANARRPIIYFAGGSTLVNVKPESHSARDELLGILVEHEDGENLSPLIWKLAQSAPIFPSAMMRLTHLCNSYGVERIDRFLVKFQIPERAGFAALRSQLLRIPEAKRPQLTSLE